jgi:hypothetical protein
LDVFWIGLDGGIGSTAWEGGVNGNAWATVAPSGVARFQKELKPAKEIFVAAERAYVSR